MRTSYRFSINGHSVSPVYDDKLSKEYDQESDEQFFRASLNGKIKFIGQDYLWLFEKGYETRFEFLVEMSTNDVDYEEYWKGFFYRNDCEWNNDDKIVSVKFKVDDEYSPVLSGYEKEYNLIKLKPEKVMIEVKKRPLIQIYIPGDDIVTCILGGMYWEQDVLNTVESDDELRNKYYFGIASKFSKVSITDDGYYGEFAGDYIAKGTLDITRNTNKECLNDAGTYKVVYEAQLFIFRFIIVRISDSTIMYSSAITHYSNSPIATEYVLNGIGSESGKTLKLFWFNMNIYMRYLLDATYIKFLLGSKYTQELPYDDFVSDNKNYKRAYPYTVDVVTVNNKTSVQPTEYGLSDNGQYFIKPSNTVNQKFYPIARSTWTMSSVWYNYSAVNYAYEIGGEKPLYLRDASPLSSVIKVLLNEVAPNLTHEESAEYSQFLYTDENPICYAKFRLYISQKSNILAGEYDRPAQNAPITLQSVLRMLKETYKCFWFIDGTKFRIEHISWFKNGGAYYSNNTLVLDLTKEINRKNKKLYSLYTDKFTYDKKELSERIEFKWMDEVTAGFEGYPIEMVSNHVQLGKKDTINPGSFTSDIDYMLLNPNAISKDGFALMAAVDNVPVEPVQEVENGYYQYGTGTFIQDDLYKSQKFDIYRNVWLGQTLADVYITGTIYSTAAALITYFDLNNVYLGSEFQGSALGPITHTKKKITIPANTKYVGVTQYGSTYAYLRFFADYKLPFTIETLGDDEYRLQNGYASWIYLHKWFWKHDLPTRNVKINGVQTGALGIIRSKKQTVEYPSKDDIDTLGVVKTNLGIGKIDSMKVNLSSRMLEIKLSYETEQ